jgi:hypothetical protein
MARVDATVDRECGQWVAFKRMVLPTAEERARFVPEAFLHQRATHEHVPWPLEVLEGVEGLGLGSKVQTEGRC